jgi:hypothetical protein
MLHPLEQQKVDCRKEEIGNGLTRADKSSQCQQFRISSDTLEEPSIQSGLEVLVHGKTFEEL